MSGKHHRYVMYFIARPKYKIRTWIMQVNVLAVEYNILNLFMCLVEFYFVVRVLSKQSWYIYDRGIRFRLRNKI